ncbi:MAG TPA: RNA-binding domain-containing protein [Desulfohalobiaceae bacterium]|nr:RNA-binding domain-containing protein [Desulfohalobiaceae bacterium]
MERGSEYYQGLIKELCKLPREVEWLEFKVNKADPHDIGEYISALSNSAALNGKPSGYLLWGISDKTHEIVGTTFKPFAAKKGNEPLESWLLRLLEPKIHFRFFELLCHKDPVVLLEISRANRHPVRFSGKAFIRIGEVKKLLKDSPDRERELWRIFDQVPFEEMMTIESLNEQDVLQLLDYPAYFDLLDVPLPADRDGILDILAKDRLIQKNQAGGWDITNLGAILFAKRLSQFKRLKRKAIRVIQYSGSGRTETYREQVVEKGYAAGFEGLLTFINGLIPSNEIIGQAFRKSVPMFPELAVRELVANALIHQDFFRGI